MVKSKYHFAIQWLFLIILVLMVVWFYWPVLKFTSGWLIGNEDYSYGLLIPFVSGFIIYLKWSQLQQPNWHPSWLGLGVMALGFCLYIFGELITDIYIASISFLVVLIGIVFLFGGWKLTRFLAFPLLILFLVVPLPDFVTRQLTLPLQLLSTSLCHRFIASHRRGSRAPRKCY